MSHEPEKHLEQAARIAKVVLPMYRIGKISHNQAMDWFERALSHVDNYNAEKATRTAAL